MIPRNPESGIAAAELATVKGRGRLRPALLTLMGTLLVGCIPPPPPPTVIQLYEGPIRMADEVAEVRIASAYDSIFDSEGRKAMRDTSPEARSISERPQLVTEVPPGTHTWVVHYGSSPQVETLTFTVEVGVSYSLGWILFSGPILREGDQILAPFADERHAIVRNHPVALVIDLYSVDDEYFWVHNADGERRQFPVREFYLRLPAGPHSFGVRYFRPELEPMVIQKGVQGDLQAGCVYVLSADAGPRGWTPKLEKGPCTLVQTAPVSSQDTPVVVRVTEPPGLDELPAFVANFNRAVQAEDAEALAELFCPVEIAYYFFTEVLSFEGVRGRRLAAVTLLTSFDPSIERSHFVLMQEARVTFGEKGQSWSSIVEGVSDGVESWATIRTGEGSSLAVYSLRFIDGHWEIYQFSFEI